MDFVYRFFDKICTKKVRFLIRIQFIFGCLDKIYFYDDLKINWFFVELF